jgi:hypothetical protein
MAGSCECGNKPAGFINAASCLSTWRVLCSKEWSFIRCETFIAIVSRLGHVRMELACFTVWIQTIKPVPDSSSFWQAFLITFSAMRHEPSDWPHSPNPRTFVARWGCVCLHTLCGPSDCYIECPSYDPCRTFHPRGTLRSMLEDDCCNLSRLGITGQHTGL